MNLNQGLLRMLDCQKDNGRKLLNGLFWKEAGFGRQKECVWEKT